VSDIIRTTLGPRSMLKMILDASGGTCLPPPPSEIQRDRSTFYLFVWALFPSR